jgi:hypothetical protein
MALQCSFCGHVPASRRANGDWEVWQVRDDQQVLKYGKLMTQWACKLCMDPIDARPRKPSGLTAVVAPAVNKEVEAASKVAALDLNDEQYLFIAKIQDRLKSQILQQLVDNVLVEIQKEYTQ